MKDPARLIVTVLCLLAVGWLMQKMACAPQDGIQWSVNGVDPVTQGSVYLNSRFQRGLDKNNYQLMYEPDPPNRIIVRVKYKPGADVNHISTVASEAQKNAKRVLMEKYHVNVTTSVEMGPLD